MNCVFSFQRTLSQADFDAFARVSGDDNPIHVDAAFSARTRFGRTVSHGMLLFAILTAALRRARPGMRLAETALMFPNPAYAGEPLIFSATTDGAAQETIAASAVRVADRAVVCEARLVPGATQ